MLFENRIAFNDFIKIADRTDAVFFTESVPRPGNLAAFIRRFLYAFNDLPLLLDDCAGFHQAIEQQEIGGE
jgi:hypothetical protein